MTQRNILLVKLLSIDAFSPILPIVIAYQTNVIGLSVAEAFTLMAIFSGSILIFEVPSGAFSDLLGRKKTLIISSILPAILFAFVRSFGDVFLCDIVNKEVPSERRATVFSLSSLHNNLWGVLTIPLVGAFIDNSGLQNTFYLMAITLLTTLVFSLPFVFKKS